MWFLSWAFLSLIIFLKSTQEPLIIDLTDNDMDYCANLKCKFPRPEKFSLADIVVPSNSEIILSNDFVLYRCRMSSGCCDKKNEICAPKNAKSVCVKFFVEPFGYQEELEDRNIRYIIMLNHTECICTNKINRTLNVEKYVMQIDCGV